MKKKSKSTKNNMSTMALIKFLAFIFPLIMYLLMILFVFPAPNSGFIALGILGCIMLGLGLVNITGLIDKMYLGHILTVGLVASGFLFLFVSSVIMYTPEIYSGLNENHITFYFAVWSLLMISAIYYPFFRHAISLDLQSNGISKSTIKKGMDGIRNYWWYQCFKNQLTYRWIFWANKMFTILFPFVCLVQLTLGWWSEAFIGVLVVLTVLLVLNFAMGFLIVTTWKQVCINRVHRFPTAILLVLVFPIAATLGLIMYFVKYI